MWIHSVWRQSKSRFIAFLHDTFMVPVAWLVAFWLRDNLSVIGVDTLRLAFSSLSVVLLVQSICFLGSHLYRGMWRYTSMQDLLRIINSVAIGTAVALTMIFFMNRLEGIPRSVLILYPLLLICFLSSSRILIRLLKDKRKEQGVSLQGGKKVLIVGAGHAAESLIRDLLRQQHKHQFSVVGLVDDNPAQMGRDIHGVRVLGNFDAIPVLAQTHQIERIMLALPDADAALMRRLIELSQKTPCLVSTLPSMNDVVDGRVSIEHLRMISIEDLLGRAPIQLNWQAIRESIHQKKILVSGGGGSIGSELCRQIARLDPAELIVIDNSEYHLFQLEQELRAHFPMLSMAYHLLDVTDESAMRWVMRQYHPHSVYHAAAYKHVPLLEYQAREAAYNNVIGTENVIRASIEAKVERFLLVSTDKAVNPTNVMGASKRIAEMVCQQYQHQYPHTQFMMVRFGNVLGSRGSVVETFKAQIAKGGPVTVTHPEVKRYFMTIPEACQLILQAASLGKGGEIFVLDMGAPVKIRHLAEEMIRLAGKIPNQDMMIEYTGLRPGEKLFEELFHDKECFSKTEHPKLWTASSRALNHAEVAGQLHLLKQACQRYDVELVYQLLKQLVPEFQSPVEEERGVSYEVTH